MSFNTYASIEQWYFVRWVLLVFGSFAETRSMGITSIIIYFSIISQDIVRGIRGKIRIKNMLEEVDDWINERKLYFNDCGWLHAK